MPSLQACTGQEVEVALEVAGGEGPFQWSPLALAPGLALEQNTSRRAVLRGTLSDVGSFAVSVAVRDAHNCARVSVSVDVAQTPVITTNWPDACTGTPFELPLQAEGGDPATYTWSYQGAQPLTQMGQKLYGRVPNEAGSYPVQVTLRDAHCPIAGADPVILNQQWNVRAPGACPSIVTSALPAACEGIAYSQALLAKDGSGVGYAWSALSGQLPSGLAFDAERGVVEGTPTGATRSGSLELLVTDSLGQRASATLDLTLRDNCRMAWIAGEPARLHVGDVFVAGETAALPEQLDAAARVLDLKFSPDGAWIAFRAGVAGAERLQLYSVASSALAGAAAIDFACPDANACAVLDYAWSRDSQHVAVVLGNGSAQDYVSGVSLAAGSAPVIWPVLGSALSDETEVPLDYLRDLSWAQGDSFGFVAATALEGTKPETVIVAQAGLGSAPQASSYSDNDLRMRPTPGGWVVYDSSTYKATSIASVNDIALHSVSWVSPSGEYAGAIFNGQLSIYAMGTAFTPSATSDPDSCGVVAAWSPRANGIERILCSGGTLDAPDGTALRVFDFDVARQVFDPPAGRAVPLNGAYLPAPLTNTRRLFTPSADWLLLGTEEQGVTLLPVPSGTVELPRPTALLSVNSPAEQRFSPDGRSLLIYGQGGLVWQPVPPSPFHSVLSFDNTGLLMTPPTLDTCEEAVWASPDNWCGAPNSLGHFLISGDSKSVLFEADGALWVSDLGIARDLPARRVAALPSACGSSCAGTSYAFAP